jgi:hypothetical protein
VSYLWLSSLCIAICLHDIDHKTKAVTWDTHNGDRKKNVSLIFKKSSHGSTSALLQLKGTQE